MQPMPLRFHTFRAVVATGVSLWMAVLACLMGCALPVLAREAASNATAIYRPAADLNQPDVMADMPNCPHHSAGNIPGKQTPVRGGRMSCCPVEVTVASKPSAVTVHLLPVHGLVQDFDLSQATNRFFDRMEIVPPVWHSGRDTLLATQLLRI
jgi:hypothetical protein